MIRSQPRWKRWLAVIILLFVVIVTVLVGHFNRSSNEVPTFNKVPNSVEERLNNSLPPLESFPPGPLLTTKERITTPLPRCPTKIMNSTTNGRIHINLTAPSFEDLERLHPELEESGRYSPRNCSANNKVAIIIAFRDREEHLLIFLKHMHPFLQRQYLDYTIFVVEQQGNSSFNRGKLFNIGFTEVLKLSHFPCFIFHDVDLLPEVEKNMYVCYDQPRHMSAAVDTLHYRLPYATLFGGVIAVKTEQFKKLNGFSNIFWGWGGEDDDLSRRVQHHGYKIARDNNDIARYTMITHEAQEKNPIRNELLDSGHTRFSYDGLTDLKYKVVEIKRQKLFTFLNVDVLAPNT